MVYLPATSRVTKAGPNGAVVLTARVWALLADAEKALADAKGQVATAQQAVAVQALALAAEVAVDELRRPVGRHGQRGGLAGARVRRPGRQQLVGTEAHHRAEGRVGVEALTVQVPRQQAQRDTLAAPGIPPMTHAQMAQHIGCSREMVSRLLKELVVGGYVVREPDRVYRVRKRLPTRW